MYLCAPPGAFSTPCKRRYLCSLHESSRSGPEVRLLLPTFWLSSPLLQPSRTFFAFPLPRDLKKLTDLFPMAMLFLSPSLRPHLWPESFCEVRLDPARFPTFTRSPDPRTAYSLHRNFPGYVSAVPFPPNFPRDAASSLGERSSRQRFLFFVFFYCAFSFRLGYLYALVPPLWGTFDFNFTLRLLFQVFSSFFPSLRFFFETDDHAPSAIRAASVSRFLNKLCTFLSTVHFTRLRGWAVPRPFLLGSRDYFVTLLLLRLLFTGPFCRV